MAEFMGEHSRELFAIELFDGLQSIAMGAIRGLNDGRTTLVIGLSPVLL
mgnify:CR=1 FL=1